MEGRKEGRKCELYSKLLGSKSQLYLLISV
jgi:hypothetical protein